jgi:hypothetical protein
MKFGYTRKIFLTSSEITDPQKIQIPLNHVIDTFWGPSDISINAKQVGAISEKKLRKYSISLQREKAPIGPERHEAMNGF